MSLLAQVPGDLVEQVATPSVDWWGIMPVLILAVPAMVLLHLSSLVKRFFTGFYAAVHDRGGAGGRRLGRGPVVAGDRRRPGPGPVLHAGRGLRGGRVLGLPHRGHLRLGRADRADGRRLPPPGGPRGGRALLADAALGVGRRDHGLGQRPDRAVPRPRDPLPGRLRAGLHAPAPPGVPGGGHEVLRAGRLLLGLLPLRHRPRLRGHRLHQPARHQRVPRPQRADRQHPAAGRVRPPAGGLRLQDRRRALPRLVARRVPGLTLGGRRLHGLGGQGGRLRRPAAHVRGRLRHRAARLAADRLRAGRLHAARRDDPGRRADRREADDGLLVDLPRRLHPRRRCRRPTTPGWRRRCSTWPPTRS